MSMAQIGEFAFIVASLGLSLGVTSDFLFPIAVGASAITTFTTPYMIKYSEPFYGWLVRILPVRWVTALNNYSSSTQNIQAESAWKVLLKSYANIAITNGIVLLALILLSIKFLIPFLSEYVEDDTTSSIIGLVVSLGIATPFLWALMAKRPDSMAYRELWLDKKYSHGPLLVVEVTRNVLGILLIGFWVDRLFSTTVAILLALPIIVIVLLVFSKRIQKFYQRIEGRFLVNLNARETAAAEREIKPTDSLKSQFNAQSDLSPWDAHIVDLEVNQHAEYIGKTLLELAWREKYGINIVYVKRGDKVIYSPGRHNKLLPFDHVGVIATDEQMQVFKPAFDATDNNVGAEAHTVDDIIVQKIVVDEHTKLKGLSIRDSGIRERTNGLVAGIERDQKRILNPDSTTVFEWGDIVWIVGERKKIQKLSAANV